MFIHCKTRCKVTPVNIELCRERFLISSLHYHYIENKIEYQIDDLNITICGASKRHLPLATHKILPGNMIPNWLYLVINLPIITTS